MQGTSKSIALAYSNSLIGICVLLVIALELSSGYLLKHHSVTYARISRQYEEAVKIRPAGAGDPPRVLMVGNSLLLHGVELDRLQTLTSTRMRIYPIFLEATGYYDWLYGLRQLFRQGARPQVVVVGVGVNYFLTNGVRQDYAPMLFFDTPEHCRRGFRLTFGSHCNKQSLACSFERFLGYAQRHPNTDS